QDLWNLVRRHVLDRVGVDLYGRGETAGTEAFHLDHGVFAVARRDAELAATGVLEKRVHDLVRSAAQAWRGRANLDEVAADGMLMVHRVEGHDALHVRWREPEHRGDLRHP